MTIPTRIVTCRTYSQNGAVIQNASYTFILTKLEKYNGLVVPQYITTTTDNLGVATVSLFPNALGEVSSQYIVKGRDDKGTVFLEGIATLPDANSELDDILSLDAYPVSVSDVDELVANALASANTATAAEVQTGLDRLATAADRVQTGLDRVSVTTNTAQVAVDAAQVAVDKVAVENNKTSVDASASAAAASAAAALASEQSFTELYVINFAQLATSLINTQAVIVAYRAFV